MILWHESSFPYLSNEELLNLYYDCCHLRGEQWGCKDPSIQFVFKYPKEWLWAYHMRVIKEMLERDNFITLPDIKWFDLHYQGPALPSRDDDGTINIEELNSKLAATQVCIYPEHNMRILKRS